MNKKIYTVFALTLIFMLSALTSCAADPNDEPAFVRAEPYQQPALAYKAGLYKDPSSGNNIQYRLYTPSGGNTKENAKGLPLIVFLHGRNESGANNIAQLKFGADYFLSWRRAFPAYVLFPQSPADNYWYLPSRPAPFTVDGMHFYEDVTWLYDGLKNLIAYIVRTGNIDPDRVILVGFSMGAITALDMASRNPHTFAGVASVAGAMPGSRMSLLKDESLWIEHCLDDTNVKPECSLELIRVMEEAGADLTAKIYPTGGHTGNHLYETPEFMRWIYSRRLR